MGKRRATRPRKIHGEHRFDDRNRARYRAHNRCASLCSANHRNPRDARRRSVARQKLANCQLVPRRLLGWNASERSVCNFEVFRSATCKFCAPLRAVASERC